MSVSYAPGRRRPVCNLRRTLFVPLIAGVLTLAGACQDRPTVDECLRSFENFLRLNTGRILSEEDIAVMSREAMSREMASGVCVNHKSRPRVLCEIQARSLDELKACDSK